MTVNRTICWIDAGAASPIGNQKLSGHPGTLAPCSQLIGPGCGWVDTLVMTAESDPSIHPSIIRRTRVRALLPTCHLAPRHTLPGRGPHVRCDRPRRPSRITHVRPPYVFSFCIDTPTVYSPSASYHILFKKKTTTGMSIGQLYTGSRYRDAMAGGPRARRAKTGHLPRPARMPGPGAWTAPASSCNYRKTPPAFPSPGLAQHLYPILPPLLLSPEDFLSSSVCSGSARRGAVNPSADAPTRPPADPRVIVRDLRRILLS